ncbi:HIRAN domain-containing protein [Fusobacterium sp. CAG:649]|uniref:HIRAN domain-containing protein n=1 Tax=Fusobacterium sp. CAG:649 TaxID=1262900 RepID=UPI00033B370C|nr:HIRAN domain-containing protein [Fusobacterium sp. CAG:649]CDA07365.1 uncharacterized protein BN748_01249 [Fusobacterium sp. CAG:649]
MKKILKYLFLLMSILSGILTIGAFQDSVISGIIMIIITLVFVFIFFIFKNNNTEIKKDIIKKQKTLKFQVAGTFLGGRQANISKFFFKKIENKEIISYEGLTNSEIKTRENIDIEIYEIPQDYEIKSNYSDGLIRFEKEPENEYDKNAIRVIIKGMGTVGYVPKNINISFGKILENKEIKDITANLSGGEYKLWNGKRLESDREDYSVTITISY